MMSIERMLSEYQVWNGTVERQAAQAARKPAPQLVPGIYNREGNCPREVLAYLKAHKTWLTPTHVANGTGFSIRRVSPVLRELVRDGLVKRQIGTGQRSERGGWIRAMYRAV